MSEEPPSKRRRNRSTVVCQRCRRKKAKCDKQNPCNQCIKANFADDCVYEHPLSWQDLSKLHLNGHVLRAIELSTAFCRENVSRDAWADSVGQLITSRASNKYMIGENPVVSSGDLVNMHMNISVLQKQEHIKAESSNGSGEVEETKESDVIEVRYARSFHNLRTSSRSTYTVELAQQDPAIRIYWEQADHSDVLKLTTIANIDPEKRVEVMQATSDYFGPLFITSHKMSREWTIDKLSTYGQSFGLSLTKELSANDAFQESLLLVVPRKPELMAYLKTFFDKIYPHYPVVDEFWVFTQVDLLFNFSQHNEAYHSANLNSREDVTSVAMILFMIGLSHLSYFTNVPSQNRLMLQTVSVGGTILKDSRISLNCIKLANYMLSKSNFRSETSLCTLQAQMLKTIHKLHSLDNDTAFCDIDGISGTGSLLSLAVSLMLNRDPDSISNFPGDETHRNLRRKVWYTLVRIEYMVSYLFLAPRTISAKQYKTKFPVYSPESSNISDLSLEEKTIQQMRDIHEILTSGDQILDMATDLSSNSSGSSLVQSMNDFECLVLAKLGVMDDYFVKLEDNEIADVIKIVRLSVLSSLKIFMAYVSYFLHLYYRHKKNQRLSFLFLKKTLLIQMNELCYLGSEIMYSSQNYFDISFSMMMSPMAMISRQSTMLVSMLLTVSFRCGVIVSNLMNEEDRDLHLMRALIHACQDYTLSCEKMMKFLGERYSCAWKCVKINSFGYSLVNSDHFLKVEPGKLQDAALLFSDEQNLDLMSCIRNVSPIEVEDSVKFRSECYQDINDGNDAKLSGVNLYKTIQTDNFWIVYNSLQEREYAASFLSVKEEPESFRAPQFDSLPGHEHDDEIVRAAASLGVLDPNCLTDTLEPTALQILDMSLIGVCFGPGGPHQGDEGFTRGGLW